LERAQEKMEQIQDMVEQASPEEEPVQEEPVQEEPAPPVYESNPYVSGKPKTAYFNSHYRPYAPRPKFGNPYA
jgi:hypothetical protein